MATAALHFHRKCLLCVDFQIFKHQSNLSHKQKRENGINNFVCDLRRILRVLNMLSFQSFYQMIGSTSTNVSGILIYRNKNVDVCVVAKCFLISLKIFSFHLIG